MKRSQFSCRDELADWCSDGEVEAALLLREEADPAVVSRVIYDQYAPDPSDDEIQTIGRDPFLIAYALVQVDERVVVTTESLTASQDTR